jgi:hypothetical protein
MQSVLTSHTQTWVRPARHIYLAGAVEEHERNWCEDCAQELPDKLCTKHGTWRSEADVSSAEVTHECCCTACCIDHHAANAQPNNDTIALCVDGGGVVEEGVVRCT